DEQFVGADPGRDVAARGHHEPGMRHSAGDAEQAVADLAGHAGRSPAAGRTTRRSVTSAVTRSAGVMSNAGLSPRAPSGAIRTPPMASPSSSDLNSIVTASPLGVCASTVDSGAATTKGTFARAAASASANVPTWLPPAPLAPTRS